MRYSLCPQSRTIGPLSDEDLAAIAPPTDVSMAAAPDYPDCARMFWQALSARFGGRSIWVPVRDVIRWLQHHGLLATRPVQVTLTDEMAVSIAAPAQTAFDPDQVHRWAVMFAAGLAPSDRRLWFLRFGRNLGFKDIAQAMGTYRGASGPHARIAKLQEALCDFIQSHGLPWLGPEEIDKEAWTVFFDTLLAEVEKDAAVPSSEGKAPSIAPARRPKDQS